MADRGLAVTTPGRRARWLLLIAALAALVVIPLGELGAELLRIGASGIGEALRTGRVTGPIINTVWTAVAVALLTLVAATAAAVAIERGPERARSWLRLGILLPVLIPPFVSALSWVQAYEVGGLLDDLLGMSVPFVTGPAGVVAVVTVNAVPLAYVVIAPAVARWSDIELELAARLAGAGPWQAFRTVTLPRLRRPLTAAGALVFVVAVNAFGIPVVLGTPAGFATATTRLYQELALSAAPEAFDRVVVLAGFLVVATLVVIGLGDLYAGRSSPPVFRVEAAGPRPAAAGRGPTGSAFVAAYIGIASVLPLVALILAALTRAPGLDPTPGNLTLANLGTALTGAGSAMRNSLILAAAAATLVLALGALVVALERRRRVEAAGTAITLAFAVPGSALAVAVLLAYGSWLRDTLLLILVAYLAKFWSLGHRPVRASVDAVAPLVVGAARVAGAGPRAAIRTVLAPLLWPALVGAWGLVFLFGLHELTMSALLYGPGSETLAVVILNLRQLGDTMATNALAVVLTLGALATAAILGWLLRAPLTRWARW